MSSVAEVFWGEIAPCEHMVQLYDEADPFLDSLAGFVAGGLRGGDGVIVIATPDHAAELHERLANLGIDLDAARVSEQYIDLDAEEALALFMRNGWPDQRLFVSLVTDLLQRAGQGGRRVRAFGEMVSLLWSSGHPAATVRLEHLWHGLCQKQAFSLFCAYPRAGFTRDHEDSMQEICDAHSRVVKYPPAIC